MNIETREVRDLKDIPERERSNWIKLPRNYAKKYQAKTPVSDADYRRILAAEEKRLRKAADRLAQLRTATLTET